MFQFMLLRIHSYWRPIHPIITQVIEWVQHKNRFLNSKLVLDSKITFNEHINHILSKVTKSIGLLRNFQSVLPRSSLLTTYKTFNRSHFDYADVVYDQSYKSSFHKKLESIQYNVTLAVMGAVRGSPSEKLYQ